MKKTLLIAALFFTFQLSNAQGNLQFNTTVYKTFGPVAFTSSDEPYEMGSFIIAENKVYKVSITGHVKRPSQPIPQNLWLTLKKNEDLVFSYVSSGSMSSSNTILLGAGTYKIYGQHQAGVMIASFFTVSGTEFNIITE